MSEMLQWREENIGNKLKMLSGFPFLSSCFSTEEGMPLIRIRDVLDSKIETYYTGSYLPMYVIQQGDILVGMDGDFHISKWNAQDALLNQRVLKVDVLDSDELDLEFVFYWLQPFIKKVNDITAATTVKHLSVKDIRKAVGKIPKKPIQTKIGMILLNIDQAIESTQVLIEKYQLIKAGLMHDLFTRGIGADGKLRPSREESPELYQETAIGWIPKEWGLAKLPSLSKAGTPHLKTGPFGSSLKGEHWVDEGVPVITIGALGEGEFINEELLFITEKYANFLREYRMKSGEIVFSRVADVGRSVVIGVEQTGWVMSSNLMRIHLDEKLMNSAFLQSQLSFDSRIKKQIRCKVNTGGREVANSEVLNSLLFVFPPLSEQQLIIGRAEINNQKIRTEKFLLEKLRKQKAGLMHDLLTGKVQVKVDDDESDN